MDRRVGTDRGRRGVDQPTPLLRRHLRQLLERGVQFVEAALLGRQEFDRHFGQQLRPALECKLIVALAGPGERREQHRTRLAQLLQTVVHDLRRPNPLELRPQVPQQNLVQRPFEQAQPLVGLHQLDEALRERLILRRAQRPQRRQRHVHQRQVGPHVELIDRRDQLAASARRRPARSVA